MKLTNFKIIISGSNIETYRYQEKAVSYDFPRSQKGVSISEQNLSVDEKLEKKLLSRKSSMLRSRSTLRRLVNANAWRWLKQSGLPYLPVFVTLTFADNVRNSKIANKIFSDFIRRFNYYITDGQKKSFLKYVVVIEFQDKNRGGVVHYHVMFFNMKKVWTNTIAEIWGQVLSISRKLTGLIMLGLTCPSICPNILRTTGWTARDDIFLAMVCFVRLKSETKIKLC